DRSRAYSRTPALPHPKAGRARHLRVGHHLDPGRRAGRTGVRDVGRPGVLACRGRRRASARVGDRAAGPRGRRPVRRGARVHGRAPRPVRRPRHPHRPRAQQPGGAALHRRRPPGRTADGRRRGVDVGRAGAAGGGARRAVRELPVRLRDGAGDGGAAPGVLRRAAVLRPSLALSGLPRKGRAAAAEAAGVGALGRLFRRRPAQCRRTGPNRRSRRADGGADRPHPERRTGAGARYPRQPGRRDGLAAELSCRPARLARAPGLLFSGGSHADREPPRQSRGGRPHGLRRRVGHHLLCIVARGPHRAARHRPRSRRRTPQALAPRRHRVVRAPGGIDL
ncbi:MAG: hypothetical protein AVDCRST_MAG89-2388, partial [uncultured Gemmatimonadetes bacterium]